MAADRGGGLYVAKGAKAGLDSLTQAHVTNNSTSTSSADRFGSITTVT